MAKLLRGIAAGLLSIPLVLIVAYVVGVVATAVALRELFATVLAATAALPLMFLFVLLLPTVVIAILTGATIGTIANRGSRVYLAGAAAGVLFAEIVLAGILRLVVTVEPGNFPHIVSNPAVAGVYGALLGLIAARLFRWFT